MASNTRKKKKTTARSRKKTTPQSQMRDEVIILVTLAVCILLLISNFGIGGFIGNGIASVLFGIFGLVAYIAPILIFIGIALTVSNKGNSLAYIKVGAGVLLTFMVCTFLQLTMSSYEKEASLISYYQDSSLYKDGGGFIGGCFVKLLCPAIGVVGTFVLVIILVIICLVLITEKSFLGSVKKQSSKAYASAREDARRRKERAGERREDSQKKREQAAIDRERKSTKKSRTQKDTQGIGVSFDTTLTKKSPDVRELHPPKEEIEGMDASKEDIRKPEFVINRADPIPDPVLAEPEVPTSLEELFDEEPAPPEMTDAEPIIESAIDAEVAESILTDAAPDTRKKSVKSSPQTREAEVANVEATIKQATKKPAKAYKFPPISLLNKGKKNVGDSDQYLRETAMKLQQTLENFNVNVHVTNVSCGPSVTRFEIQPEQGVKVSKIVGLADDIKLNLAAADIRIEAPIPGKAAVGIEVPNKENSAVMLRDLLESEDFKNNTSKIAFAAGRDIAGKVVVADIMKMPHLLIAGATGSGKSVCINTLIMSILYKAHPDDVKLIMIDPKVVELSVYNGIPHLMIPVVTDPKKAAGALNWAVAEMSRRYNLFAEYNVRDLKGYNAKIKTIKDIEEEGKPVKMPQLVIIVDELADLMMVAPGEVEEAICRLAQLARAAGIHLVLATQRPSVNVITGLIKANMPSRIAFSVSSGVDSRTIIDMNGAEKLLGKGDMLFYPQGYQKPARVQGSFVSDKEVQDVVTYLVSNNGDASYNTEVANQVNTSIGGQGTVGASGGDERDVYFVDAGKFIIEKDKASIGMLQRVFKIGFNRAARIMDQLADAGVVGEEEGTKPRKVLMSMEEFEQYIEEYV